MNKFESVKEIIDEWDPINLLPHAPDDEYEAEIKDIVKQINLVHSSEELSIVIHNVFSNWFGKDSLESIHYTISECQPIAEKIWSKMSTK